MDLVTTKKSYIFLVGQFQKYVFDNIFSNIHPNNVGLVQTIQNDIQIFVKMKILRVEITRYFDKKTVSNSQHFN